MKRRREPELEDTGNSSFVRKKRVMDPEWTDEMDNLLIEEIATSRRRERGYCTLTEWNRVCWNRMLLVLQTKNSAFTQMEVPALQLRAFFIKNRISVDYTARDIDSIPAEHQALYNAFKVGELPPPPDPPSSRRKRSQPSGNISVRSKNTYSRSSLHTTNINTAAGSSMGSQQSKLAELLTRLRPNFTDDEMAKLLIYGKPLFQEFHDIVEDEGFIAIMKQVCNYVNFHGPSGSGSGPSGT